MTVDLDLFVPIGYGSNKRGCCLFHSFFAKEDPFSIFMGADGSSTPIDFFLGPEAGKLWVPRSLIYVLPKAANPIDETHFGTIASTLSNGISLDLVDDEGTQFDFLSGVGGKIRNHQGFVLTSAVVPPPDNPMTLCFVYDFTSAFGMAPLLGGPKNRRVRITVADDLSSMVGGFFTAGRGVEIFE